MENLEIETIKGPFDNEVSFCPARGGIITSLKLKGQEIFYFDQDTFIDLDKKVRGGIPVLFPNAGSLSEDCRFVNLTRHGFARDLKWEKIQIDDGFKEVVYSNNETKQMYPFDFGLFVSGYFETDGSFSLTQEVENMEEYKDMPISMGFHPYFKVADQDKKHVVFNFRGGDLIKSQINAWYDGDTVSIDNPKIYDDKEILEIKIPTLGIIRMDVSAKYKKIWVWSLPGKDFICIEPVMGDCDCLIDNPTLVKPADKFLARVNFQFIEQ